MRALRRRATSTIAPPTSRRSRVRLDGRALEPRALPLARGGGRGRTRPDHEHLGRHRGRRLLPRLAALPVAQGVLARTAGARHVDGRLRARRQLAARQPGEVGELVCTRPWPAQTRGVFGDPERYLDAYWRRFPGVWTHGDWATVDADGEWFLHGRSDDTLNVAGKRIGPSEYESAVVADPDVVEACAVGIPHDVKGEVVWCLCVLRAGVEPSEELRRRLRARCARRARQGVRAGRGALHARRCRRRAAPRSCGGRSARRCSARIRATLDARGSRGARRDQERGVSTPSTARTASSGSASAASARA